MIKTIKIQGKNTNLLDINLQQILKLINNGEQYYWDLLWLEGVGKNILKLEKHIKESQNGYILYWNDLIEILNKTDSIEEVLLIGDNDRSKLMRYESDTSMRDNCKYSIELLDSSYWLISSVDNDFIKKIYNSFEGITSI